MPSAKASRSACRVRSGLGDVMKSRQENNNLSELQVNWIGKGNLNANESDLMYKYHVVSKVYNGPKRLWERWQKREWLKALALLPMRVTTMAE